MENEKAIAPDFTDCPYWGVGGRYVVDPVTGKRTPVAPTAEPESQASGPTPELAAEAVPEKPMKEKRRV